MKSKTGSKNRPCRCYDSYFRLLIAAAAGAFVGDSPAVISRSGKPAPGTVAESLPIAGTEAFAEGLAPFGGTPHIVVIAAAAAIIAAAIIAAATAAAATITSTTTSGTTSTTTSRTTSATTTTSTSNSKATHISHLLFYKFVLYHMGRGDKV